MLAQNAEARIATLLKIPRWSSAASAQRFGVQFAAAIRFAPKRLHREISHRRNEIELRRLATLESHEALRAAFAAHGSAVGFF